MAQPVAQAPAGGSRWPAAQGRLGWAWCWRLRDSGGLDLGCGHEPVSESSAHIISAVYFVSLSLLPLLPITFNNSANNDALSFLQK